jgi:serine/threonine-protein kinase HipA
VSDGGLSAVRSVEVADVYKAGVLAAQLRRHADGVEFRYVDGYGGPAVATTLPVGVPPRTTAAGAVPPFFAGLLPEGRRLSSLRRLVKTSADDELSLLLAVGRDTIGDVAVVPEGHRAEPVSPVVVAGTGFEAIRFSDLMADAGIVDRIGLPGVQDKVSAAVISVPVAAGGEPYILKLDPPEYPHVVENEAYFLGVARRCGLDVVQADVVRDADNRPGLLVRRFDRVAGEEGLRSLACEDACQLLDRWPADKYNVSAEAVVAAVSGVCASRVLAARDVFRQVCFAWLTGNGDVHAKNVSVLRRPDGEWRVSPVYDVPSTAPYGDRTLALPVLGTTGGLSRRKLLAFAVSAGLPERAATRVLDEVLDGTASVVDDLLQGALPFDRAVTSEVVKLLRYRRRVTTAT